MRGDERLEHVLSEGAPGSVAQQFLAALRAGQVTGEQIQTRPLPLQQIRDIYQMRARWNKKRGDPIEGYEDLLAGLDAFACDAVVIRQFWTAGPQYVLFTDAQTEHLAGVLRLPPKPADAATLLDKVA